MSSVLTCLLLFCVCVLQAFKQLDKDGSGTISMEELAEACK